MEGNPRRKRLKLSLSNNYKTGCLKHNPASHDGSSEAGAVTEETGSGTAEPLVVTGVSGRGSTDAALLDQDDSNLPPLVGPDDEPRPVGTSQSPADVLTESSAAERPRHREAYYSANFKTILKTVLSDSPERHVISEAGANVVEQFLALPGASQTA